MTQAKRKKTQITVAETPTPPFFVTIAQLASLGLDSATAGERMTDANALCAAITALGQPGSTPPFPSTRDALTQWAQSEWPGLSLDDAVARLNDALSLVQQLGVVVQVG